MRNVFIISGPAGSGKDAIIDGLETCFPLEHIITTTTRSPRAGETEGHPYHFISQAEFEQGIAGNQFIEYSINENNAYYGVTREAFEQSANSGHIVIWKIDWKGVLAAKQLFPGITAIFVHAPLDVLEQRLRTRDKGKDEAYFEERMKYTKEWLKHTDIYDYTIENEQGKLDEAIQKTAEIIKQHTTLA